MGHLYDLLGDVIDTTDKTLSIEDAPADAKATGDMIKSVVEHAEPSINDIPGIYLTGRELPQSKEEGKIPYKVEYVSNTLAFEEYCTLKPQGDASLKFPKKNFNIQFYKASDLKKKSKHAFRGWGEQSKYTLKANWADPTHARNVVTANLWADMVRQRSNYSDLPAELLASPNLGVIDGFPVKVFWNGVYLGRYTLNIPKDKWMYNMDDELENNVVLYGEGRASDNPATNFYETVKVDGHDWSDEIHEDDVPQSVIDNFNAFIEFVINSTDADFVAGLSDYVDIESILDVILLAWVDCGVDSLHKNQIFISYDGAKYYGSVYDLDSTWGMSWDGSLPYPYNHPLDAQSFVRNNLYEHVKRLFPTALKKRYAELRTSALSEANIAKRFNEFSEVMSQELIERDWAETTANGKYTEIPSKTESTIPKLLEYVTKRLTYIDSELSTIYPMIEAIYSPGSNVVLMQEGIDATKKYLTIKYYESASGTGVEISSDSCELLGEVAEGSVPVTVRYNGYTAYFTATFTDYYSQDRWYYPDGNAILQKGYNSRANIWGHSNLTMQTSSSAVVNAVTTRGNIPFFDHTTHEILPVYPIPVSTGANKFTATVVPSDIEIKMSLWEEYAGAGRYSRSQDPGILGTGTAVWSNVPRSQDYNEFLCVEFRRTNGSVAVDEIESFSIDFDTVAES